MKKLLFLILLISLIGFALGQNQIPTNNNALCIYNINSPDYDNNGIPDSKDICEYYKQVRYDYSVRMSALPNAPYSEGEEINLLELNIPIDAFEDTLNKADRFTFDSVRNGNAYGEPLPVVPGIVGNSFSFDGTDSARLSDRFSYRFSLENSKSTMCGWFNANEPHEGYILEKRLAYGVRVIPKDQGVELQFESGDVISSPGQKLSANEWHHFCVSWITGDKADIYVDGKYYSDFTNQEIVIDQIPYFSVGGSNLPASKSYNWLFKGKIDEVLIFNDILSFEDIKKVYNNGLIGTTDLTDPRLYGYIPLEDVRREDRYEEMNFDNFMLHVKDPVDSFVQSYELENPGNKITHIAVAKYIPTEHGEIMWLTRNKNFFIENPHYSNFDNPYYGSVDFFNPTDHPKIDYVASYLNGFNLDDIKSMIDKSVNTPPIISETSILIDDGQKTNIPELGIIRDGTYWFPLVYKNLQSIINQIGNPINIEYDNADTDFTTTDPTSLYIAPGSHHRHRFRCWSTNGQVQIPFTNRAVTQIYESYSGVTFHGGTCPNDRGSTQGLTAQSISTNAFGGLDYSNSISGGFSHTEEPGAALANNLYWTTSYINGLTLAESAFSAWLDLRELDAMIIGDPLMRLYDTKSIGNGLKCSDNSDCRTGLCSPDFQGTYRCHHTTNFCVKDLPGFGDNALNSYSYETENGGCYAPNSQETPKLCIDGIWEESPENCGVPGASCNNNEDCKNSFCSPDLFGDLRCHDTESSCVQDETGKETDNTFNGCSNDILMSCNSGTWEIERECGHLCFDSKCYDSLFTPPNIFAFKKDERTGISLNFDLNSYDLDDIFPNPPDFSTISFLVEIWTQNIFVPSYTPPRWDPGHIIEKHDSADFVSSEDTILTIQGDLVDEPTSISLNQKNNFIGIPSCLVAASEVMRQIDENNIQCDYITTLKSIWWSNDENIVGPIDGEKSDFDIEKNSAYFMTCDPNINEIINFQCPEKICTDSDNDKIFDYNRIQCSGGQDSTECIEINPIDPILHKPTSNQNTRIEYNQQDDLRDASNVKFINEFGLINFNDKIKLVDNTESGCFKTLDITEIVKIQDKKIEINSNNNKHLNKPAKIIFYNINFEEPLIKKDGSDCQDCSIISFDKDLQVLEVSVSGFSIYEVVEGKIPEQNTNNQEDSGNNNGNNGGGGNGGNSNDDTYTDDSLLNQSNLNLTLQDLRDIKLNESIKNNQSSNDSEQNANMEIRDKRKVITTLIISLLLIFSIIAIVLFFLFRKNSQKSIKLSSIISKYS